MNINQTLLRLICITALLIPGCTGIGFYDHMLEQVARPLDESEILVGELEENRIGSNCGQYVLKHIMAESKLGSGYLYKIEDYPNEETNARSAL